MARIVLQDAQSMVGLHITRLIVEAHGGQIWAESPVKQPDETTRQGSTFAFALPIE